VIKIDKAVPLPKDMRTKYPFKEMKIGDSFFVSGIRIQTISGLITQTQRRLGTTYTARTVAEADVKGVRVWRIK
jgi:hypothetical protein